VVKLSTRRVLARFLVIAAIVYVGIAIFFAATGLLVPAVANALTAVGAGIVARMIISTERGGPNWLLASAFIAALVGVNVIVWTTVF
jgi:hypothetical protein